MTENTNRFEKVIDLYKNGFYIGNKEFDMALLIAIRTNIANAAYIAKSITNVTDISLTYISDSSQNYNAVYIKEENSSIIQYNISDLTYKVLSKIEEGYHADFLEKFVFALSLSVLLHEFGHHINDKSKDVETKSIEDGIEIINYVDNIEDSVSLSYLENDENFFKLLLKAQMLRIQDEKEADIFAEEILRTRLSVEINDIIHNYKNLEKDLEYYWFYAVIFLEILTDFVVVQYSPADEEYKREFIEKMLLKCKNAYLQHLVVKN